MNCFLLQHLLMDSVQKDPNRKAVVFDGHSISYQELEVQSSQIAMALKRLDVQKGDRVALLFSKSIDAIIAIFAILKTGAAYVPIDPMVPSERVQHIISRCGVNCLLTSEKNAKELFTTETVDLPLQNILVSGEIDDKIKDKNSMIKFISWNEIFSNKSLADVGFDIPDTYPAYILFTSGSTGIPKGVVISHQNSVAWINMASDFFKVNSEDVLSNQSPFHFDMSVFDIFVAIKCGATIVIIPEIYSLFPTKIAESIRDNRISIWNSVPTVLSILTERMNLSNYKFDSLRLVLFAGSIYPINHLKKFKNSAPNAQFYNMYGQTEANSSMYYRVDQIPLENSWKIPLGKVFPNFEAFALDNNMKIIDSPGDEGELYIRGSTVAIGYWQNREQTEANFLEDPRQRSSPFKIYRTGDIVKLDQDLNYVFVGRKDNLVKCRGYRIEIDEIELVLHSCPGVSQAAIIPVPDEICGNRLVAYIATTPDVHLNAGVIFEHCHKRLPKYMIPEIVECCQSLPSTSTGKIDRQKLFCKAVEINFK